MPVLYNPYDPTTWVDDVAPFLEAENLNKIEQGIKAISLLIESGQLGGNGGGGGAPWLSGYEEPPPELGNPGDWYLNLTSDDLWLKSSSTGEWELVGNLRGAQGAEGPPGPPGPPGPRGVPGIQWIGPWMALPSDSAYEQGSAVSHNGSSWIARDETPGDDEPREGSDHWDLLAQAGVILVFEQPDTPDPDPATGSLWIDTDEPDVGGGGGAAAFSFFNG